MVKLIERSPDWAGLQEYRRLTGDSRQLDAIVEETWSIITALSGFSSRTRDDKKRLIDEVLDRLLEPVSQLDGYATSAIWAQLGACGEEVIRFVCEGAAARFSGGVPMGPWTRTLFVFDDFEDDFTQSIARFVVRDGLEENFQVRARAMSVLSRCPLYPTSPLLSEFRWMLEQPELLSHAIRVVQKAAPYLGMSHWKVDGALIALLAISGEQHAVAALEQVWSQIEQRPRLPGLWIGRFAYLLDAGRPCELGSRVRRALVDHLDQIEAGAWIQSMASHGPSVEEICQERIDLFVYASTQEVRGPTHQAHLSIRVSPESQLVGDDPWATWLFRVSSSYDGLAKTHSHRGVEEGKEVFAQEIRPTSIAQIPRALREYADHLDLEWDLEGACFGSGQLVQRTTRMSPSAILAWLRAG